MRIFWLHTHLLRFTPNSARLEPETEGQSLAPPGYARRSASREGASQVGTNNLTLRAATAVVPVPRGVLQEESASRVLGARVAV